MFKFYEVTEETLQWTKQMILGTLDCRRSMRWRLAQFFRPLPLSELVGRLKQLPRVVLAIPSACEPNMILLNNGSRVPHPYFLAKSYC